MNDVMSVGLHRIWKNSLIEEINPNFNMKLIDVAGGTGDISFRFLNHLSSQKNQPGESNLKVTVCDINSNMLEVGKKRSKSIELSDKITWKVGNAEDLKDEKDNSYDVYTIAFGIRNCTHLDKVVKEAYRVLKPGGRFLCLEFSKTNSEIIQK
jgi:2-methoxy-6-polyprenyl-1,4-benzoquinol methylase